MVLITQAQRLANKLAPTGYLFVVAKELLPKIALISSLFLSGEQR
jgi:hypothetical protein